MVTIYMGIKKYVHVNRAKTCTRSHPSWSTYFLYHLSPFTTIHGILFVQFTSLTVLSDNLFPGPLWSSSWS